MDVRKEKENETFLLSMRRFLCREALTFPFRCDCEIIFVISIVIEPRRAYQSRKRLGNTTGARYLRSTCSVITRATRPGNDCNYACVSVSHRGYEHACTCVHTRWNLANLEFSCAIGAECESEEPRWVSQSEGSWYFEKWWCQRSTDFW